MAFMFINNNKYYPLDNLGDNPAEVGYKSKDGFWVDTLLAYPISLLNNKGYRTSQCCEGHPLKDIVYISEDEYIEMGLDDPSEIDSFIGIRRNMDEEKYACM